MIRRPPRSTRTDTLFPYTTLFRSLKGQARGAVLAARRLHADLLDLPAPGFRQALSGVPDQRHRRDLLSLGERRLRDECLGQAAGPRSEERRGGEELVITCRSGWSQYNYKTTNIQFKVSS